MRSIEYDMSMYYKKCAERRQMIRRWYRQLALLWWSLGTYSVISATKLLHQMEGGREEKREKEKDEREG